MSILDWFQRIVDCHGDNDVEPTQELPATEEEE